MDIGAAGPAANRASRAALDGRYQDAIKAYQEALSLAPHAANLHYALGLVLAEVQQDKKAIKSFQKASQRAPHNPEPMTEEARLHIRAQRYDLAKQVLEKVLEHHPTHAPALNNRGVVAFLEESYSEACDFFERAVQSHSQFRDAWFNLADTYAMLGNIEGEKRARSRYYEVGKE